MYILNDLDIISTCHVFVWLNLFNMFNFIYICSLLDKGQQEYMY